jgi:enoyl-CoA hydratase/carnithine racemase
MVRPDPTAVPRWETIDVTCDGDIVEFRFHSGGAPLIWTAVSHNDAYQAFRWIGAHPTAKVLIVTGTGDRFCTELDTTGFAQMAWHELWWEGRRMTAALAEIDIPVISAVNGPVTIHAEIPVMADIVLAAEHAEFADHAHFAVRDSVPGDGANIIWCELLGRTRAMYFLLTGERIPAHEGKRIGFVNEVLPTGQVAARAREIARNLARRELSVLRYAKDAIAIGTRRDLRANLSHGLGVQGSGHAALGGIKPGRFSPDQP